MTGTLQSQRLILCELSENDADFIRELVNRPEWKQFIGDRAIHSREDSLSYISKIQNSPHVKYWLVKIIENEIPIGIITFIQRDYLDHPDLGFAFLKEYTNLGFAYEAAQLVMENLAKDSKNHTLLASTLPSNVQSVKLLEKLGFQFSTVVLHDNENLQIYKVSLAKVALDVLCRNFFQVFGNSMNRIPDLNLLLSYCLPSATFVKIAPQSQELYSLEFFIDSRKKILMEGTLQDFEEMEMSEVSEIVGDKAERISTYMKRGIMDGRKFIQKGQKRFLFDLTATGWKINCLIWEDEE